MVNMIPSRGPFMSTRGNMQAEEGEKIKIQRRPSNTVVGNGGTRVDNNKDTEENRRLRNTLGERFSLPPSLQVPAISWGADRLAEGSGHLCGAGACDGVA